MSARMVSVVGIVALVCLGVLVSFRWSNGVDLEFAAPHLPHPHGPTVPVPPPGEVLPAFLEDGWPVFVVRHEDGSTDVLSAVSPHRGAGLGEALVWCPSSQWFEELQHAATFSEWGAWMGGPAPTGLVRYPWRPDAAGIRIDGPGQLLPRGVGQRSEPAVPLCVDDPDREFVAHRRGEGPLPSPRALMAAPAERWRPADAAIVLGPVTVALCSPGELVGDRCPGDAPRFRPPQPLPAGGIRVLTGPMLVWVSEDELRPPILLAETVR